MKKYSVVSILAVFLLSILTACSGGQQTSENGSGSSGDKPEAPDKFLQVGSGPMGSGWYPITTVLSEVYMDGFQNLNVSQIEGGSTANLKSLEKGDIQFGINYTSDFADAVTGEGIFDEKLGNVSSFASLYPVYQTIATLQDNKEINSIEDIVDKHIFLGPKDGGGPVAFWRMMDEYGINEDSIKKAGGKVSYGNYSDGASMLADGNVDVFVGGGAPQVTALQEIEMTNPVKVIPLDEEKLESLKSKGLGISADNLPSGTYKGMEKDIPTYTTVSMFTVRSDLQEEYVYNLTKLFWDSIPQFEKQIPERAKHFTLETALDGIDPETLHPGAKKYYEEAGVLK